MVPSTEEDAPNGRKQPEEGIVSKTNLTHTLSPLHYVYSLPSERCSVVEPNRSNQYHPVCPGMDGQSGGWPPDGSYPKAP
jgi:hypothetical protein